MKKYISPSLEVVISAQHFMDESLPTNPGGPKIENPDEILAKPIGMEMFDDNTKTDMETLPHMKNIWED